MENVIKKSIKILTLILLFAALTCFLEKNPVVAFQENFSSNKLTYEETFENGEAWQGDAYAYQQLAGSHSFNISQNPIFRGKFNGRFELRYGDPMVTENGGPRAEVLLPKQSHRERWYSFAVYFPSNGWKLDNDDEIVSQWHANNGTPPLALRVKDGKLRLRIGHNPYSGTIKFNYIEFGDVPKDEWNEFVFHVIHSEKSDGLIEVWKNGEKFATYKGPNLYLDGKQPRWKIGIYKSNWSKKSTDVNLRITYFDNVKIGNENATLEDMMSTESNQPSIIPVSGISTTAEVSSLQKDHKMQITATVLPDGATNRTVIWSSSDSGIASVDANGLVTGVNPGNATITAKTQDGNYTSTKSISVTSDISQQIKIEGFSIVNASTNNAFKTLSDGDKLDYSQLKDMLLNFRTHTYPEKIGSVNISLSGPVNSSRTDNGFTYDLLYNSGIQLPQGEYTLTAIPYTETDKGGTQGPSSTIKFELVDVIKAEIPTSPTPISPENGSNGVISAVNLEWQESDQSNIYSIQVAEDMDFEVNLINKENISTNKTEIDQLNAGKTYFWRVKAQNASGSSSYCEPWSFITNAEIPAATSKLRIEGFSLLDAATNMEISGLSDGDRLDYSQFKDMILNFRVHTYPEKLGSVAIALKGPANSSRTDNGFTYDLLNKEGLQLPKGEYTLTATPYGERENGGEKGTSFSIGFSIMEAVPEVITVTGIKVEPQTLSMDAGTSAELAFNVFPSNASNKRVVWSSSDASIAAVDEKGLVTALEPGIATVTAKSEDGEFTSVSTVTVSSKEAQLAIQSFSLVDGASNAEFSAIADGDRLEYGQIQNRSIVFRAHTFPEEIGSVAFSLEGPTSASKTDNDFTYDLLSSKGLGLAEGEYSLTATPYSLTDNGGEKGTPLSIRFTVSAPVIPGIPQPVSPANESKDLPTMLILDWDQGEHAEAYEVQVADNSSFSNPAVDQQNIKATEWQLTGLEEGIQYYWRVRATAEAGLSNWSDTWAFQTMPAIPEIIAVTGVSINPSSITMELGGSHALEVTVSPSGANNQTVVWSSSDTSVVTVNQNGLVKAVRPGVATIAATSEDGGFTSVSTVTVPAKESHPTILSFSLVDAASNRVIHKLSDGEVIDIHQTQELEINFRAISSSPDIGSVFISLSGPVNISKTDNVYHYELLSNGGLKLPVGNYTLTAIPYTETDKGGTMGIPFTIEFTVAGKLEVIVINAPELVSPSSGDEVDPNAVQLFWIDKTSADKYEVQVSKNSGFIGSELINSGQIINNQLEISGLEHDQVYYWRVRAQKDTVWSEYSSVWNFQTLEMPDIQLEHPVLVSPAMGEKLLLPEATLNWEKVEHASYYHVYLSIDQDFNKGLITYEYVSETSLDISSLEENTTYYWKVEAIYKQESKFSEVENFRTGSTTLNEGSGEKEAPLTISMYPNPVEDILHLEFTGGTDNFIHVTLAEMNGNIIFSKTLENYQGLTTINLSNYKMRPGMYLISVQNSLQQKVMKLRKK